MPLAEHFWRWFTAAEVCPRINIVKSIIIIRPPGTLVPKALCFTRDVFLLRGVSVAASPVLATIGMSVCPSVRLSVRHTLALSENDAS